MERDKDQDEDLSDLFARLNVTLQEVTNKKSKVTNKKSKVRNKKSEKKPKKLSKADRIRINRHIARGRLFEGDGDFQLAAAEFNEARKLDVLQADKLEKKVASLQAKIKITQKNTTLKLPLPLSKLLHPHQQEGVQWMYGLFQKGTGGILADDMGMGKTLQVIALVRGLQMQRETRKILIICPVAVLAHWRAEFKKWTPRTNVAVLKSGSKKSACKSVLLTTYGMVVHNVDLLKAHAWAAVVLDEGHRIKNHRTIVAKNVRTIHARLRLILSGTPMQNNLAELWSLLDFCTQLENNALGSLREFKKRVAKTIERSNEQDASNHERLFGGAMGKRLHREIQPYFLRREKKDSLIQSKKTELICWIPLSHAQREEYRNVLTTPRQKSDGLVTLSALKKICDQGSAKIDFTVRLVEMLIAHPTKEKKILFFSQSRKVLAQISQRLAHIKHLIIDGTVTSSQERRRRVMAFNQGDEFHLFLLTTGAGGEGLTLTGADTVIIYDPAWNPTSDAQAVDRAYRIGQQRDVTCFRLMTCSTVEEKIYRRQLFKSGVIRNVIEQKGVSAVHSSKVDLRNLFTFNDPDDSELFRHLSLVCDEKVDAALEQQLMALGGILGVTLHCNSIFKEDTISNDQLEETLLDVTLLDENSQTCKTSEKNSGNALATDAFMTARTKRRKKRIEKRNKCCLFHANQLRAVSPALRATTCRCHLTDEQRQKYNSIVAELNQSSGERAAQLALHALQICSDDAQLHLFLISAYNRIEL
eukprot:g2646.t1